MVEVCKAQFVYRIGSSEGVDSPPISGLSYRNQLRREAGA